MAKRWDTTALKRLASEKGNGRRRKSRPVKNAPCPDCGALGPIHRDVPHPMGAKEEHDWEMRRGQ